MKSKKNIIFIIFTIITMVILLLLQLNMEIHVVGIFGSLLAGFIFFCTFTILKAINRVDDSSVYYNFRFSAGGIYVVVMLLVYTVFIDNHILGFYLIILIFVLMICTNTILKTLINNSNHVKDENTD